MRQAIVSERRNHSGNDSCGGKSARSWHSWMLSMALGLVAFAWKNERRPSDLHWV